MFLSPLHFNDIRRFPTVVKKFTNAFPDHHSLMRPKALPIPWKGRQAGLTHVATLQNNRYDDNPNFFPDSGSEELEHLLV